MGPFLFIKIQLDSEDKTKGNKKACFLAIKPNFNVAKGGLLALISRRFVVALHNGNSLEVTWVNFCWPIFYPILVTFGEMICLLSKIRKCAILF